MRDSKLGPKLVTIKESQNTLEAFALLKEFQFQSLPMLSDESNDVIGMVCIMDLLKATLLSPYFNDFGVWEEVAGGAFEDQVTAWLQSHSHVFERTLIKDVIAKKPIFRAFYRDESLASMIGYMLTTRSHRVLVCDREHPKDLNWYACNKLFDHQVYDCFSNRCTVLLVPQSAISFFTNLKKDGTRNDATGHDSGPPVFASH